MIYIDGDKVTAFNFPAGERHVYLPKINASSVLVEAYLFSSDSILDLLLTVDAIKSNFVEIKELILPYLPFGRQDRQVMSNEPRALKVFCDLINSLEIKKVKIYDPHSYVSENLIKNVEIVKQATLFYKKISKDYYKNSCFIAPDMGAEKKVIQLVKLISENHFGLTLPVLQGIKARDNKGEITNYKFESGLIDNKRYKSFFVVDDICDGGATFLELAKALLETYEVEHLYLYVTHGIFSKGLDELNKFYDKIFCWKDYREIRNESNTKNRLL